MSQRSRRTVGLVEACLPSPAKAPPSGPDWLHEIKHDGFRIMARRDAKGVRLYTQYRGGRGDDVGSCALRIDLRPLRRRRRYSEVKPCAPSP